MMQIMPDSVLDKAELWKIEFPKENFLPVSIFQACQKKQNSTYKVWTKQIGTAQDASAQADCSTPP